ncbi:MAG: MerR family transcriptional regulator [Planctomycetota bacterium]
MALREPSFDIAELARQAGISSRTLRYYGELGLVRPEGRGAGGRRLYGPEALERVRFIRRLKNLGLTLMEIGELNQSFGSGQTASMLARLEALLEAHLGRVQRRIEELQALEEELQRYRERIRRKRNREDRKQSA